MNKQKTVKNELPGTEDSYQLAVETARLGIWARDYRTGRTKWNLLLYEMLGRDPEGESVTGETFFEYIHEADRVRVRKHLEKVVQSGNEFRDEFRIVREDGDIRWLVASGRIYRNEQGEVIRTRGIHLDITERKQVEEALSRERNLLQSLVDTIPVMLVLYDPKLERFTLNKHARDVLGWTNKDANQGDFMSKVYPDPAYRKKVSNFMDSLHPGWREFNVTTKTGDTVPSEWTNIKLNDDTRIGIGIDIRRQKKAEQAILGSEKRLQTLADHSPDIIARFDRDFHLVYINQTISGLTGMPPEKLIGKTSRNLDLPDFLCDLWEKRIDKVIKSEKPDTVEFEFPESGEKRIFYCSLIPEFDQDGRVETVLSVARDVTPRRRAERDLKKERDLLEVVMDNTNTHLAYLDREFNFVMVNSAYARGCGYSEEELIGNNHFDIFPDKENQAIFKQVRKTGKPFMTEAKPFEFPGDPDRGMTYWDWSLVPVKDSIGEVTGLVYSLVDVTEDQRAIAERERFIDDIQSLSRDLKNQTARLEAVIGSLTDPILVFNPGGKIIKANPAAHAALGREPVSIQEEKALNSLLIPPESSAECPRDKVIYRRALSGEMIKDELCLFKNTENQMRYVLVSASPIEDPFEMNGAVVTWHDITDRRQRQEKLQESEQRYCLAQQLAGIGNWDWDIRSGKVEYSNTLEQLFCMKQSRIDRSYRSFLRLIHPEDRRRVTQAINACIEEDSLYDVEHRVICMDGSIRWLRQTGNVIRDQNRLAVRMLGMVQDITDQKQAVENQRLLAEIVAESQDAIVVRDMNSIITAWNTGAERIYGYATEEMIGHMIDRILPEDKRDEEARLIERTKKGEHIRHYETNRIRKDNRSIYVAISFSPLRDIDNTVYAVATIEHDITERVLNEHALREAKQQLERQVQERTKELRKTNRELKKQIRQRSEFQDKLRSLTAELIRAEERQRREIAAGLHDSIIQMLVLSNMKLDQAINIDSSESQKPVMEEVHNHLEETIRELRSMTFQISPPVLYELGLIPALEWLSEQFEKEYGLTCHFTHDHTEKPVSEDMRNMLFQAVHELLMNVVKHADAENVHIRAMKAGAKIQIEVKDDGCGFNPDQLKADMETTSGFGLFNIQERIEFMKGQFKLISEKNKGTYIRLKAPLDLGE